MTFWSSILISDDAHQRWLQVIALCDCATWRESGPACKFALKIMVWIKNNVSHNISYAIYLLSARARATMCIRACVVCELWKHWSDFWAHLCILHGGLICVAFCLSVWTLPIRLEFNSYLGKHWSYQSATLPQYRGLLRKYRKNTTYTLAKSFLLNMLIHLIIHYSWISIKPY